MSKVLDEQSADSSTAAPVPVQPTYMQRVLSLKGPERAHYDLTGELPNEVETEAKPATPPVADEVPEESSPKATKGPDLASGDEDPEQLTPAQRRANNRNLRNELIKANAEKELLKTQLAESRRSAPTVETPKVEAPKLPTGYPLLKDFTGDDALDKWQEAVIRYNESRHNSAVTEAVTKAMDQFELKQRAANWEGRLKAAKSEFKDFDAVALSDKNPISFTGIRVLQAREDFGKIAYYLGQHPEEAKRIADATTFENDDKLNADPIKRAKAEARLEAEYDSIARLLATAPTKKTSSVETTDLPRPSSEVNLPGKATVAGDPIAQALKNKDFKTYSRLKNEEEAKEIKARR